MRVQTHCKLSYALKKFVIKKVRVYQKKNNSSHKYCMNLTTPLKGTQVLLPVNN